MVDASQLQRRVSPMILTRTEHRNPLSCDSGLLAKKIDTISKEDCAYFKE